MWPSMGFLQPVWTDFTRSVLACLGLHAFYCDCVLVPHTVGLSGRAYGKWSAIRSGTLFPVFGRAPSSFPAHADSGAFHHVDVKCKAPARPRGIRLVCIGHLCAFSGRTDAFRGWLSAEHPRSQQIRPISEQPANAT